MSFIEMDVPDAGRTQPEISELVGHSSMYALAENKGNLPQCSADGRIRVYIAFRCDEGWLPPSSAIPFHQPAQAREATRSYFHDWGSPTAGRDPAAADLHAYHRLQHGCPHRGSTQPRLVYSARLP
ncbi:hypothetical protein ACFXC8_52550 [Streptomyces sp. NPDC059441]|uniref:hypothetical protein n=1 Tax=Streptomyces sp. NPDC059441 TaxID=3346829 RepID=UPI003697687B